MYSGEFYDDWVAVSHRNPDLFGLAFDVAAFWFGLGASECNSIPCEGCLDNTCVSASLQEVCGPRPGTPGNLNDDDQLISNWDDNFDIDFDEGEGAFGDTDNGWAFSTSCLCGYTLSDMSPYDSDPNIYQGDSSPLLTNFNEVYGEPSARPTTNSLPCPE